MKQSLAQMREQVGVSYLGKTQVSSKLAKGSKYNVLTYGVYLAPSTLSGYNVCPNSAACKDSCLNGSGHNKVELMCGKNRIQNARIKKTKLLFEDRKLFTSLLFREIEYAILKAERSNMSFAVRLNCTSDIDLKALKENGLNIFELFPNVQFYDYTKVASRVFNNEYKNYDLTLSFNGYNKASCIKALENGNRVAVVFSEKLPETYWGFKVVDGDKYDMRYLDMPNVVVGLKYKHIATDYKNHKFEMPSNRFIVAA